MSQETTKALRRRFLEDQTTGHKFWDKIFRGSGLDVGSGDDPIRLEGCQSFDKKDGDANNLSTYFKPNSFNYIHASQLLEHLVDPEKALLDWRGLLKRNGYIVATVPDWCLYEGMIWPSRYNGDHKSTWSLYYKSSPAPIHIYVPEFIMGLHDLYACLRVCLIDTNYNYKIGTRKDQTQNKELGVEAWIEFVLRKK